MNKDDQELLKLCNKRIPLKVIVDVLTKRSFQVGDNASREYISFRADYLWEKFYPVNENKILATFIIGNIYYALEVDAAKFVEQSDALYIKKINKEVKYILSGAENYYCAICPNDKKSGAIIKKLKDTMLEKEPEKSKHIVSQTIQFKNKTYAMVGEDRSHLARTAIYICNKMV